MQENISQGREGIEDNLSEIDWRVQTEGGKIKSRWTKKQTNEQELAWLWKEWALV